MKPDNHEPAVEQYRSYLLLLARMQLNARPQSKVEASDVVQHTLLEAHAKRQQFCGDGNGFAAWLRMSLANNIRDALRQTRRQKRDVSRERSLEAALEQSSDRLGACLAAAQSSPSRQAVRTEELLRLSDALVALPDAQRESIVLHHLQGWTLAEVATQLDRTDAAWPVCCTAGCAACGNCVTFVKLRILQSVMRVSLEYGQLTALRSLRRSPK